MSVHHEKVNLLPCSQVDFWMAYDIMHVFYTPQIRHQRTDRVVLLFVQTSCHCKSPSTCKLLAQNASNERTMGRVHLLTCFGWKTGNHSLMEFVTRDLAQKLSSKFKF